MPNKNILLTQLWFSFILLMIAFFVSSGVLTREFGFSDFNYTGKYSTPITIWQSPEIKYLQSKEIKIKFRMKVNSVANYDNVFQTASGNSGIRMELGGSAEKSLGIIIGEKSTGLKGFLITRDLSLGEWHDIFVHTTPNKRITIYLNNVLAVDEVCDEISYDLSDIVIGTGFSRTRPFDGKIRDFSINGKFFYTLFPWITCLLLRLLSGTFFIFSLILARGETILVPTVAENSFFMLRRFLVISAVGVVVFFLYYWLLQDPGLGLPQVNLLFDVNDRYMDFFNVLFAAKNLNTNPNASPCVFSLLCYMINKVVPALSQPGVKHLLVGKATFAAYTLLSLGLFTIAFNGLFKKFHVPGKYRLWFLLIFILSYPVVFAVDRGNSALLTGALMALFLLQYINGKTFFAALLLAFAISLKYYYAVFGVLFIIDRKWRDACVTALFTAFLLYVSLTFSDGGFLVNLKRLYSTVMRYNTVGQSDLIAAVWGHNTSIYTLFDVPYCAAKGIFGKSMTLLLSLNGKIKLLANAILLLVVSLGFVPKIKLHDKFLLLTAGMLLFPLASLDYIIPVFFFPAVYWILSEPDDRVMPWLASLYVICKRYIPLYNHGEYVSVTIQAVLNPMILLIVIGYIVWMRRTSFLFVRPNKLGSVDNPAYQLYKSKRIVS